MKEAPNGNFDISHFSEVRFDLISDFLLWNGLATEVSRTLPVRVRQVYNCVVRPSPNELAGRTNL